MKKTRTAMRFAALAAALVIAAGVPLAAGTDPGAAITASAVLVVEEGDHTEGTTDSLYYNKYSDHVTITGHQPDATSFTIPAEIDGTPVTRIGDYAFNGAKMSSIEIPDSITYIGHYAFALCNDLTSVTLPSSLEMVNTCAFQQCYKLATVEFPATAIQFESRVFDETPWLEAQRAKDPIVIVNDTLIDGATYSGGDLELSSSIKHIAGGAFYMNTKLTSIVAPGVQEINDSTFWHCENLTKAELPSITEIGVTAFGGCTKLQDLKIPGTMKAIQTHAFTDCTSHATITVYGTEDQWRQVQINDSSSDFLKNATYIFDSSYVPPTDPPEEVIGDVNDDGVFTVLDIVALQKWLLAVPGATLKNNDAADMDKNDIIDIFDLGLMKRALLEQ
ncbi:MAG: leucine-rich repeat protein [Oscillospiraceae bacterium]|nr:leucine-rich repeat protein [Oscillospiraceae bacterium]